MKITLNARNNVLVYFYITTSTLLYFLRLQRGGTIAPPKSTTDISTGDSECTTAAVCITLAVFIALPG